MKKTTLVMALSLAIGGLASVPASAAITVVGGHVDFTGEIVNTTCLVNDDAAGDANRLDVVLAPAHAADFGSIGVTANPTDFVIKLGGEGDVDCANGKVAAVSFDSTSPAIDGATGYLTNTASANPAKNVQIQILSGTDVVDLRNDTEYPQTIANNTAEYNFTAQYISVKGGPVTAGQVASTVKYNIVYQ
jgi:major type 1 subunit fimbrin (pilin)